MLTRLAELYARGAEKYGDSNWTLANSKEELDRFKASAFRHFVQWQSGELDEDHAIATVFNIFAYETISRKICPPLMINEDGQVTKAESPLSHGHTAHVDSLVRYL